MKNRLIDRIIKDDEGSNAVEFALVAPVFLIAIIGFISLCFALFSMGSLQFAVEGGARCGSVQTETCPDTAAIEDYIESHYYGVSIAPIYAHETLDCGNSVTASFTYTLNLLYSEIELPITVSACYP